MEMVSVTACIYMATKHLLDFYSAVGLLLVFGETKAASGNDDIISRIFDFPGNGAGNAQAKDSLWGTNLTWSQYVIDASLRKAPQKSAGKVGNGGEFYIISANQKSESGMSGL